MKCLPFIRRSANDIMIYSKIQRWVKIETEQHHRKVLLLNGLS